MAAFGKLSGTVVVHNKLQTLHEFKRDPTETHLFSSCLIKPIPGRCFKMFYDSVSRHALRYAVDGLAVKATIKRLADLNCEGDKSDACGVCDGMCF